jgi:hypothetical protein
MNNVSPISNIVMEYIQIMPEAYQPTDDEKKLLARFALEGTVHLWTVKDKIAFIALVNKRAGLPFGTIGLIRTEYNSKGETIIKEIPYASRQTTVELGKVNKISVHILEKDIKLGDYALFQARATDIDSGRQVDATGCCALVNQYGPLKMDAQANKIMHAETKAKRRATLEICGLAFLDDTEVDDMENTVKLELDDKAGDVVSTDATTKQEAPKGNGKPAPAPKSPAPPAAETAPPASPQDSPASTASSEEATTTAKAQTSVVPIPKRYAGNPLFEGDENAIVADKAHVDFIVNGCKVDCGWDGPTMSKWLLDTFGVRAANMKETLTLATFKRIMTGVDTALTSAGR